MAESPNLPSKEPLASFGFLAGPRIGEELAVVSASVSIGSGADNDLILADDSVSKRHALLEHGVAGWMLTDLQSTNGTTVEGVKLAPQVPTPLPYGAAVRFGALRLQFREVEGARVEAASEPPPRPARPAAARPQPRGFRLPVWVVVLIVLLIVLAILVYRWTVTPGPMEPVPQTVSSILLWLEPPPS